MPNHVCNDDCFSNRTSHKYKINCTYCEKAFNLKCFDIVSNPCIKLLSSDQNGFFFCGNCHDKIMKLKVKDKNESRKSRNSLNSRKRDTISSMDKTEVPANPSNGANYSNSNSNNVMNVVNNKFDKLELISNDLNQKLDFISGILNKFSSNDSNIHETNLNNVTIENIFKQVLKLDDKVNRLHTADDEKKNMQVILSTLDNKANIHTSNNSKSNNIQSLLNPALNISSIENWSIHNGSVDEFSQNFAGRPSLTVQQTVNDDIMDILKSSEQTTWQTLDYLTKEIRLQNEKIDTLLQRTDEKTTSTLSLKSPLVESILNLNESLGDKINLSCSSPVNSGAFSVTDPSTGNFVDMKNLRKEAIAQNNSNKPNDVPETIKINEEKKRQKSTSSVDEPECVTDQNTTMENNVIRGMAQLDNQQSEIFTIEIDADEIRNNGDNSLSNLTESSRSILIDSIHDISHDNIMGIGSTANKSSCVQSSKLADNSKLVELHLSKLPTNINEPDIIEYVMAKIDVSSNDIILHKLVKKDADLSLLTFVSFKIDTNETIARMLMSENFWPDKCLIKEFVNKSDCNKRQKKKSITTSSISDFLAITQSKHLKT